MSKKRAPWDQDTQSQNKILVRIICLPNRAGEILNSKNMSAGCRRDHNIYITRSKYPPLVAAVLEMLILELVGEDDEFQMFHCSQKANSRDLGEASGPIPGEANSRDGAAELILEMVPCPKKQFCGDFPDHPIPSKKHVPA